MSKELVKRPSQALGNVDEVLAQLAVFRERGDWKSVKELKRRAEAALAYIESHGTDEFQKEWLQMGLDAAQVRVEAERTLGKLDFEQNPHGGNREQDSPGEPCLGVARATRAKWRKLGQIDDATFAAAIEKLRNAENPEITTAGVLRAATGKAHVANNSGENEWYTPAPFIEAARAAMGGIDLDPASNDEANEVVKAKRIFTVEDNGLEQDWKGRVWLNPPYAQPLISEFAHKLCHEFGAGNLEQACILVNNATETAWFQVMAYDASSLCFPSGRVKFWHPDRDSATPLQGQAVLYLGPDAKAFKREFSDFGLVVRR